MSCRQPRRHPVAHQPLHYRSGGSAAQHRFPRTNLAAPNSSATDTFASSPMKISALTTNCWVCSWICIGSRQSQRQWRQSRVRQRHERSPPAHRLGRGTSGRAGARPGKTGEPVARTALRPVQPRSWRQCPTLGRIPGGSRAAARPPRPAAAPSPSWDLHEAACQKSC
jgi:hypothetical protein